VSDIAIIRLVDAIIPSATIHPIGLPPPYNPPPVDMVN
jgi:hypothetical protein